MDSLAERKNQLLQRVNSFLKSVERRRDDTPTQVKSSENELDQNDRLAATKTSFDGSVQIEVNNEPENYEQRHILPKEQIFKATVFSSPTKIEMERTIFPQSAHQETPRVLFQRNLGAANQANRAFEATPRREERIINELSTSRAPTAQKMDLESIEKTPSNIVTSRANIMDEESIRPVEITFQDLKPKTEELSPLELVRIDSAWENLEHAQYRTPQSNQALQQEVEDSDSLLESEDKPEIASKSASIEEEPEIRVIASFQAVPLEERLVSETADEQTVICQVDGDDKENAAPIILQAAKKSPSSQQEHLEAAYSLYMDIDKEPVFAEENLAENANVIIDDEIISQKLAQMDEEAILEQEEMIVDDPAMSQENLVNKENMSNPQAVIINARSAISKVRALLNERARPLSSVSEALKKSRSPGKTRFDRTPVPPPRRDLSTTNLPSKSQNKPAVLQMSLTKRPPTSITPNKFINAGLTTPRDKHTNSSQRSLEASKLKKKTFNQESALRLKTENSQNKNHSRGNTTPKSTTAEKFERKPSVPKFSGNKPTISRSGSTDQKNCSKVTSGNFKGSQLNFDPILLPKKPPVPKFDFLLKERSRSNSLSSKPATLQISAELPRKPAVPKFCELLKRNPTTTN